MLNRILVLIAFLSVWTVKAQTLTLTAPNGGEKIFTSKTFTVKWQSVGAVSGFVKLEYSVNNGLDWTLIQGGVNNTGTFSWVVPAGIVGANCLVKVSDFSNAAILDQSDAVFSIQKPFITVTSPNGGEALVGCATHKITWEQGGEDSYVKLYYSIDEGLTWIFIADDYIGDNSNFYNWSVPSVASSKAKIKITGYTDKTVQDESNTNFSISKGATSIALTSPNGGESWSSSSSKTITWVNTGTVGNVSLKYSKDGGTTWDWVRGADGAAANSIANTGSFEWIVAENTNSTTCLVQVYEYSKTCVTAYSANLFTIDNNPVITITAPTKAEKLYFGRSYQINWSASFLPTNYVKLEYSTDNGTSWTSIINSTYNYGYYSWTIPAIASTKCLIKVSAAANAAIAGISKEPFSIAPQMVTLKTPNGGESLVGCSNYSITWDQEGIASYVSLYYSLDEGLNWQYIGDDYIADNTNSYAWSVPSINSNKLKIKITAQADANVKDSSDAAASVSQSANFITLTSLNNGETISSSSNQIISWTNTGTIGNVSLQYSLNAGKTWDWIRDNNNNAANSIANTGSYNWLVPANTVSAKALVRVYEYSKNCVRASSAKNLTINNGPVITITAPVVAEKLYGGNTYQINWSSSSLPTNYVKVEYSADSGTTWTSINNNSYNYGYISWKIPKVYSTKYLVRISSVATPTIFGVSAKFTVAPQTVSLKTPNGGESLVGCSNYSITWDQEGIASYVSLYYSIDEGLNWQYIGDDYIADNTNSYVWSVPSINSNKLKIKITAQSDASVKDSSDAMVSVSQSANFITLTSLNNGETISSSSNQIITWTNTGTIGNVSLQYSLNAGATWDWIRDNNNNAANSIANTGSYNWLVPANTVSSKALVRVYEYSKNCVRASSAKNLTINNDPVITITAPVVAEKLYGGNTYQINWSASSLPTNYVKVEYSADSGTTWISINNNSYNYGYISWKIPKVYSTKYLVRISSVATPSIFGVSAKFTVAPQTVTLKTPNGGESLPACGTYRITWDQVGLPSYMSIYYSIDGGNIWSFLADDYIADNTNYYDWKVPSISSTKFKIKIASSADASIKDSSDNVFTVTKGITHMTMLSPIGGENFSSSSIQKITWQNVGVTGNVSLKYSKNGGATWEWVTNAAGTSANNVANTGSYDWLVPANTLASNCLVQVYDYSNTCNVAVSNNYFSINNNPFISITSPVASENYYFGETKQINWSSSSLPTNYVKMQYSIDSGKTWTNIIASTYNYGYYSWKVPTKSSTKALIKISSTGDSTVFGITPKTFKILAPIVKVLTPNTGNENWLVGENKNITWSTTGLATTALMKIEYSANSGKNWIKIKDSVANSGSYIWTVPNIATSSKSFIKVSSVAYTVSKDSNDFAFTITKPIVGVTAPNDGQVWYIGESKSIQWAGMGTSVNVKIELSTDSAKTFSTIASTANTGQYFWTIPYNTIPSQKAFIRISDVLDNTNSDISDTPFSILKPTITLTSPSTVENWYLGQTKRIAWNKIGLSTSKIKIEYSGNKGISWTQIALASNLGYYDWSIPATIQPTSNAYLRISDENDASIKDSTDVAFKIVKPSLQVAIPNGGEILYIGQTKVITWQKDGAFSPNVRIDYSPDGGLSWKVITASVANTESYSWILGSSLVLGTNNLLRIRDAVDSTIIDFSNSAFTISKPTITITSPNGGETLFPSEAKNITWSSAALASSRTVKIEWSSDNGLTWSTIAASAGNNGTYAWTPTTTTGSQNLIKISDVQDPTISDRSNATFSVGKPSIALELSGKEVTEGATSSISAKITRTGAITNALVVSVASAHSSRLSIPTSVMIPAGQAGVTFTFSAPDNSTIDGTILDTLSISATGFQTVKTGLSILDNDKPTLSITNLPVSALEGNTVTFRINTDLAPTKPLSVFLTSGSSKRFPLPASVTIPVGSLFVDVPVALEQDNIPEVDIDVTIVAGSAGYISANKTLALKDDDIPSLELVIESKSVAESAGPFATKATLRRTSADNSFAFTANLSASVANALIIPSSIPLAAGEVEKTFTIGIVENQLVDGDRNVKLTASVYVNSCGCNAPSTSAGTVSANLTITDNDGPTLTLSASQLTLAEGNTNAGYLRVTRNTASTTALTVNLSSSDTNEAIVPKSVIIPVGKDFLDVPITTKNDGLTDGNKQVYFYGSAATYSSGSVWVMVTDQNLPDLQISNVILNPASVQAMSVFNYQISVKNTGFATAPTGVKVRGYLSKDNVIDEKDSLISEDVLGAIPSGQTVDIVNAIKAPNLAGDFKLLYYVNPESQLTELLYNNNKSEAVNFRINPDYTATCIVAEEYFTKGNAIAVAGVAKKIDGLVAANSKVEVYVITNGLRRIVNATTDATGKYSATFTPLANETGYYTIGASFPGMEATAEQDNFNILGVKINNGQIPQFKVILNDTIKGTYSVTNLSKKSLTNFTIAPVKLPNGAQIQFGTIANLAGNATATIPYTIRGTALSAGSNYEIANLNAISNEGTIQSLDVFYFCQAPNAFLVSDVSKLEVTASSSKGERQVEIRLVNKGRGESGVIKVNLPQLNWLTTMTPKELPSLASGDSAIIVLKFLALPEVPFNYPIKGNLAIVSANGNSLSIPFSFEKVAESNGTLKLSVTNQFTYFTDDAPKVANARVKVQNYFSGVVYAEGVTDSSGVFFAKGIPEGKHRITVEKDKHLPYSNTITIEPGDTTESTVFINYQAITFDWSVVPTAVQDKYEITLVTQFETHVPMPVVIVDMPKKMPKLSGSEIYAFNVTLTNKGLITAEDVKLTMPTDPEYEFVMNYEPGPLLAQQSIQIPVIMRVRSGASASLRATSHEEFSDFLGIQARAEASGDCQGYSGVVYWYKCNFSSGLWEKNGVMFSYEGRICGGNGSNGPSYSLVVPNNMWYPTCAACPYIPVTYGSGNPEYKTEKKSCVECIYDVISAVAGCLGGGLGDAMGKVDLVKCVYEAVTADEDNIIEIIKCYPLPLPPPISCAIGVVGAMNTCAATSSARLESVGANARTEAVGSAFFQIRDNFQNVIVAYKARENWSKEYFGSMMFSDAKKDLIPLTEHYISNQLVFPDSVQAQILAKMAGYEITESTLKAFFVRWNNSVTALRKGVKEPNTEYPYIINWTKVKKCSDSLISANDNAKKLGYESLDSMFVQSYRDLNTYLDAQSKAVCASVKVQFSQELTMTREAFEGTLEISNGHPTDGMKLLSVDIKITDAKGVPSNDLFEIQTKSLTNLSDVTGTGAIPSQQKGTVKFLFIPELGAAPTQAVKYNFGGTVRYWDPYAQAMVSLPLADVPLTVNPSPNLMLHYFMQRNILGDDALTSPDIEPSIPAELAVMVENQGYGPAVNMVISSAQPKVIENEKGLAINFNLIGSNFQGQPKNLGVTNINFGTIPALQTRIGQWYFTSSLLGKFVSYEASVVHSNSFGNPDLSLVKGVKLHELTKSIRAYGSKEDVTNDFLVNDIFDVKDRPDVIYFSQGNRTEKVYEATSGSFSAAVSAPTFTNKLTVTASDTGWNFVKLNDPGNKRFDLVSVTRNDGQVIPLDNAWLTFVTLPAGSKPVYENKFHFVDNFANMSPVTYTVVWKPRNLDVPTIVSISGAENITSTQVEHLKVQFSKSIDGSTFNYKDVSLTFQGGANIADTTMKVTKIDSVTFDINVSKLTTGNGFYNLTVQAKEIADTYGIYGETGKSFTWSQFLTVPTIQAFQGIPESHVAASFDKIQLLFNLPIDASTVTASKIKFMKDSVLQTGTVVIDSVRADKKLFYLSGLGKILTKSGTYTMTVDLPTIKTTANVFGLKQQSTQLIVDNEGPKVLSLIKSNVGGLDLQHIASVGILFDEEAIGFNISHMQLRRNGDLIFLKIDQLSNTNLKNWTLGNFGMLTYPEGEYTLTVDPSGVKDAIGNAGTGVKEITWRVDRSAVELVSGLTVMPDLGFSNSDGITSGDTLRVAFNLTKDVSEVTISQVSLGNESVLVSKSSLKAGAYSIPVTLLGGGELKLKVAATGQNGGIDTKEKALFVDQIPLTVNWKTKPAAIVSKQPDSVQILVSAKLLSVNDLLKAIVFKRNGTIIPASLNVRAKSDTVYEIYGMRIAGAFAGNYDMSIDLSKLSKYSSGKTGTGLLATTWEVSATNKAPIANAGTDVNVSKSGFVLLEGSASSDPDGDLLTYQWVAPEGIVLIDATKAKAQFVATSAHNGKSYSILLIVKDGAEFSTDLVNVTVNITGQIKYFADKDGDGFGIDSDFVLSDTLPKGYVEVGGDCNDLALTIYPGALELMDGKDNDCDIAIDEDSLSVGFDDSYLNERFELIAYPSPAIQQFNVVVESFGGTGKVTLLVSDEFGRLIETIENASTGQNIVLGKNYPQGLYIIQAISGDKRKTVKIIKL